MPFDPIDLDFGTETVIHPSLSGLIQWLEKQPPDEKYDYKDCGGCLLHSYFSSFVKMPKGRGVGGDYWRDAARNRYNISPAMSEVSIGLPWTFGAALQRAREW